MTQVIKASICLATYNKPDCLVRTLGSILAQSPSFDFEIIVVDDGSTQSTREFLQPYFGRITYIRIDRTPSYRNPAIARNVAYKKARGEIIICQSDDVLHYSENCIEQLVDRLQSNQFLIATVFNIDNSGCLYSDPNGEGYGDKLQVYTSPQKRRPLFFLGSLWRKHLYTIGGNDEDFIDPSREDVWFALCLTCGLGLKPSFSSEIIGHHQHHSHCMDYEGIRRSRVIFNRKVKESTKTGIWQSSGGSWSKSCA